MDPQKSETALSTEKNFVHEKLKKWKLEEYIDAFDREEINEPISFLNVSEEIVANKLIKQAGPFTRFIIEREKLKKSEQQEYIECIDEKSQQKRPSTQVLNAESPKRLKMNENVAYSIDVMKDNTSNEMEEHNIINNIDENRSDSSFDCSSTSSSLQFEERSKNVTTNSILSILQKTSSGRYILKEYKTLGELSDKSSKCLSNIIIDHFVYDSKTVITRSDFINFKSQIKQIFPSENPDVYYRQSILKKQYESKTEYRPASGRLYDRYKNVLKKFRELERDCNTSVNSLNKPDNNSDQSKNQIKESLQWLNHNKEPWDEVMFHWKKTSKIRYEELMAKGKGTVDAYMAEFPIMTCSLGHVLINIDFMQLYGDKKLNIYTDWPLFFEGCFATASGRNLEKAKDLTILLTENLTKHSKVLVQILLLSYILPPHGSFSYKHGNKKETYKPTIYECQRSMIVHIKIAGDIQRIHEQKIEHAISRSMTIQPYIIAIGPTLKDITNYCVVVDKVRYEFNSPLKALESFFQIFHVCHVEYPLECKQIMYVLQKGLFKIDTIYDKCSNDVLQVLKSLKKYTATTTSKEVNS